MGANVTKQETDIFKKNVTDASVEIMNSSLSSSTSTSLGMGDQNVIITGSQICGGIDIRQGVRVESRVFNEMDDQQESTLQRDLENRMETLIQRTLEQSNSDFNLGQVNKTSTEARVRSEVYQDLSTTIAKETKQEFNNRVSALASQRVELQDVYQTCVEGPDGRGVKVHQNINLINVVKNVMNSSKVDEAIVRAADRLDFTEKTDLTQSNEGLTIIEDLTGLAQAFTGPIIAMIVIIPLAVIIGFIMFYFVGKKVWGMNPFVYLWRKMSGKNPQTAFGKRGRKRGRRIL